MHLNLDFPTLSLLSTCILSSHLTSLAWTPPNPPPKNPYRKPDIPYLRRINTAINIFGYLDTAIRISHYALLLLYPWSSKSESTPSPAPPIPLPLALICPHAPLLSASLFTWSPFSILCQGTIIACALLRLLAFAQLGTDFSFQLAEPRKLKTDGLYAWLQHPSYVGAFGMAVANSVFLYRVDGVLGCCVPSGVLRQAWWVTWGLGAVVVWLGVMGTVGRVREEEKMLKGCFGREWEEWHGRTARFVPGFF